jgi:predicted ATPase
MHLCKIIIARSRFPTVRHFPFNLAILKRTTSLHFRTPITFFSGENGTGKSTLLKAVARRSGVNIWQGEQRIRYAASPYENHLSHAIDLEWIDGPVSGSFFDSQVFRHFAQILDDWAASDPDVLAYFGGKSLMQQSHGQSLMSFFNSRFKVKGLYILDEPETALSPKSQIELLTLLKDMASTGHAQFIIASHSPILLACPGAKILSFDHAPVRTVEYEDTDYYRIYKQFLDDRWRYF